MGRRILLAENNETLAKGLCEVLRRRSFEVTHQADGVSVLRTIAASPPDLLLLDLCLPGLHGLELLKKLRQNPRTVKLPVIILNSLCTDDSSQKAAGSLGVEHYLEKPFKAAQLITAVEQILGVGGNPARPVSHHLQDAFRKQFSGQLILEWPETKRTLLFVKGAPVSLRPGFTHLDFGDFLRHGNLLSDAEYHHFSTTGAFRHECLVELGCLDYTDLLQAKLDYLREELEQAFDAPPAKAVWQEVKTSELMQVITLNVPALFYRGYCRFPEAAAARRILAKFCSCYPVPAGNFYRHINFLELRDNDKHLLHRMDGHTTLAACIDENHDPAPLLLTLLSLNMLAFSPIPAAPASAGSLPIRTLFNAIDDEDHPAVESPLENFDDLVDEEDAMLAAQALPPSSPIAEPDDSDLAQTVHFMARSLEDQNHYEVFGIKPSKFSIGLLKERYFAITRQFGPEILMQLGGTEASLVEEILSRVSIAYDTLSNVVKKERYDELLGSDKVGLGREGDDRFQAQVQTESGKMFIEMEEWDNAEKALQEAAVFDPNSGEVLAHLAWAIARNPRHTGSQAMQNKARQMLNKALTMERTAQGFAYKGWMLLENGQDLMAESEFSKALKLDARNAMARKGLRIIREKQEQEKKGLLKRMFK
jgi:DNA-binding response OmpR family regulator/tetratricopeptide (TPR) repeat protein